MREGCNWLNVRQAVEAGMGLDDAAEYFEVPPNSVRARASRNDWGGWRTRTRRDEVVRMLLKAGERLCKADGAEAVDAEAKRVGALANMAKALRAFDPRLSVAAPAPVMDSIEAGRASALRMRELDDEVERLIDERARELLAANDAE